MHTATHSQLGMFVPGAGGGGGGGRVRWISSDRDDQRMFLGFNFSILGFWGVGKFGKNFFVFFFQLFKTI